LTGSDATRRGDDALVGGIALSIPPTPAERVVLAAQVARAARLMEVSYAPPGALFEVEPSAYYPALDRLADDPAR
jgi:hypothetical protein